MKLSDFYKKNASDQWFSTPSKRGSIHQLLEKRGFSIYSRPGFIEKYSDLEIPVNVTELSRGSSLPSPLPDFQTTFIAKYHFEFKGIEFDGKFLSDITSNFMKLMPGQEKYLVSLHDSSYLFAVKEEITFDDVFTVARSWSIDCFIGVFDSSQKMCFVFDAEFGVAYFSFATDYLPSDIKEFSESFNATFENDFVQNGVKRTGADPGRIAEYYEKVVLPAIQLQRYD